MDKVIVLNEYDDEGLETKLKDLAFRVDPERGNGYGYLTEMPVRSMTRTRISMLDEKIGKLNVKLDGLRANTARGLWRAALDEWQRVWVGWLAEADVANRASRREEVSAAGAVPVDGAKRRAVGGARKKKLK